MVANVGDLKQARLDAVVEVGRQVGDLIGEVDQLRLERRTLIEQIAGELGVLLDRVVARVLDDAFANAQCEVESSMGGVALLEVLDDAQRMHVVVEAPPVTAQAAIERTLSGMTEGRVADVVNQGQRFGEVFIQAKCAGRGAGDLRDLNGVGEAAAKVVRGAAGEDLRLSRESAKRARLHNPLAITLEGRARGADRCGIDASQQKIGLISRDCASMEVDGHVRVKCNGLVDRFCL